METKQLDLFSPRLEAQGQAQPEGKHWYLLCDAKQLWPRHSKYEQDCI